MNEKLNKYLTNKSLDELASLRNLISSICRDYDTNLTTYTTLNDDRLFQNMPRDVAEMHERRNKLSNFLMKVNAIIEDKLFKLYE